MHSLPNDALLNIPLRFRIPFQKSDLVSGLPEGKSERLASEKDWMTSGEYGLIQFAGK
jgi:hypothetical protein